MLDLFGPARPFTFAFPRARSNPKREARWVEVPCVALQTARLKS